MTSAATRIGLVVALGSFGAIVHCQGATSVTVDVTTDLPCSSVRGVAIFAGAPGTTELGAPSLVTQRCEGAAIGTVTLVPAGARDAPVAVKIVLALDGDVESCTEEREYRGCIVARRLVRYRPHSTVRVPVTMRLICKDVPCGTESTCSAAGMCISATTDDSGQLPAEATASANDAATNDAALGDAVAQDGSSNDGAAANDGSSNDAAANDGAVNDGAANDSGSGDAGAPPDGGDAGPLQGPLCGAGRCPIGQRCCGGVTNVTPLCSAVACADGTDGALVCTGTASCPSATRCCERDTSGIYTTCRANINCGVTYARACETNADCTDGNDGPNCSAHPGKNYGYCQP